MATLVSILNLSPGSIGKIVVTACLFMITLPGFSQRKYYEFNNPEALKLNKKRIAVLTSTEWGCKQLDVYIRGAKATYPSGEKLVYNPNGTYSCRLLTGTWKVQYNRYLVHTASSKEVKGDHPVLGIYSVTHLTDSSLVLTKLQSSARDMVRKLTFQKGIVSRTAQTYKPFYPVGVNLPFWEKEATAFDTFRKVFDENEAVNFYVVPQRYNVSIHELDNIDSLALAFVKKHGGDYRGRSPVRSLKPYFRQYVGYLDKAGHHIVYFNALTTYHSNWEKDLILPSPGTKVEGFRVYVDLTRQECFGLTIYGN